MAETARTPMALVHISQSALVVRLAGLLATLVATLGRPMTPAILVGVIVAGVTSYVGLTRPAVLQLVGRHPSLALVDLLILTVAAGFTGADSPYVLVLLPSALLVGLWVDLLAGVLVVTSLVGVYLLSMATTPVPSSTVFVSIGVIPFIYLALWYLGLTIRRAIDNETDAQRVMHDAIASNAGLGERAALARVLHDSVAKTVQGLVLTSAALPTLIQRDPARATARAQEVQAAGTQAVHELREVMGALRERSSGEQLSVALTQAVLAWQQRTHRIAHIDLPAGIDTSDEAVRYELLSCLSEALDNVHRHAGDCEVRVEMKVTGPDELLLQIVDDGQGMTVDTLDVAKAAGHYGVAGIRERMARVGGHAEIDSAPGRGTTITLRVQREGLVEA